MKGFVVEAYELFFLIQCHHVLSDSSIGRLLYFLHQGRGVKMDIAQDFGDGIPFFHSIDGEFRAIQPHVSRVRIAKKIMKITENLLIGPDQEKPDTIRLHIEFVQR